MILTLWLVVFLSLVIFVIGSQIISERRTAIAYAVRVYKSMAVGTVRARFEAALGMDKTGNYDVLNDPWSHQPSLFETISLGDDPPLTVSLEAGPLKGALDEERFINLNKASFTLLVQHFKFAAGLEDKDAALLASAVQDWRDLDTFSTSSEFDTEVFGYAGSYACKNAPFESLEELRLVYGMDENIYQAVVASSTIYGKGQVNLNTAPAGVIRSLGAPDSMVEKILRFQAGSDGAEGTPDDGYFESVAEVEPKLQAGGADLTTDELNALNRMKSENWIGVGSGYFRLPIHIRGFGKTWVRNVVVSREGEILEMGR